MTAPAVLRISELVVEGLISVTGGTTDVLPVAAVTAIVLLVVLIGVGDGVEISVCIVGKHAAVISSSNNSPISSVKY